MSTELLERETELAACSSALRDGQSSRGGLVLLEGAPGVGKTSVLSAAIAQARSSGMQVLTARAAEGERAFAFGVVRQLLDPLFVDADEAARDRLFAGSAARPRPVIELTSAGAETGEAPLHGLFWLFARLAAEQPLVLAVDDLHWADDASRSLLAFVGRRLEGLALTLLLTARPIEPGAPAGVLDVLAGEPSAHRLYPQALSAGAVARLVDRRLGASAEAFSDACHAASTGNPFLVGELLAELKRRGVKPTGEFASQVWQMRPDTVMRALTVRLGRLPAREAALTRAIAILGDGAPLDQAADFAQLYDGAGVPAVEELVRLEIIEHGDSGLSFVHPLVRSAVEASLKPAERAELHARAAELLADDRERAALHLLHVPPRGDSLTAEILHDAGRRALDRAAPDAAIVLLRRALAEPPAEGQAGALHLTLGQALALDLDEGGIAVAAFEQALVTAQAAEDRVAAATGIGRIRLKGGDLDGALAAIAQARETLQEESLVVRLEAERILALRSTSRAIDHAELAALERRAAAIGGESHRAILGILAIEEIVSGESALAAETTAQRALAGTPPRGEMSVARVWAGITLVLADALGAAQAHFSAEIARAQQRGSAFEFAVASCWRGVARLRLGDLAGAEEDCTASLEAGMDIWLGGPAVTGALIEVHVAQGNLAAAHEVSVHGESLVGDGMMPDDFLRSARAGLALAEGRHGEALALAFGARDHLQRTLMSGAGGNFWATTAVAALLGLGRLDEARELASRDLASARRFDAPWRLGLALRTAALVEPEPAQQVELLEDAAERQRGVGARLELARTLLALGQLRRDREVLIEAAELVEATGASAVAAAISQALVEAGALPRRHRRTGPQALTAAERRSARLAAKGASNPEIAAALFVTTKTVEKHLTATYRKLGVRSRSQLAFALDGEA
jgi:DNA-binding CsgD family transcriptional regulator